MNAAETFGSKTVQSVNFSGCTENVLVVKHTVQKVIGDYPIMKKVVVLYIKAISHEKMHATVIVSWVRMLVGTVHRNVNTIVPIILVRLCYVSCNLQVSEA